VCSLQRVAFEGEFITLAQLLKKVDLVSSGGEVKAFLATESITVNGVKEERRGRKLRSGDLVAVNGQSYELV